MAKGTDKDAYLKRLTGSGDVHRPSANEEKDVGQTEQPPDDKKSSGNLKGYKDGQRRVNFLVDPETSQRLREKVAKCNSSEAAVMRCLIDLWLADKIDLDK